MNIYSKIKENSQQLKESDSNPTNVGELINMLEGYVNTLKGFNDNTELTVRANTYGLYGTYISIPSHGFIELDYLEETLNDDSEDEESDLYESGKEPGETVRVSKRVRNVLSPAKEKLIDDIMDKYDHPQLNPSDLEEMTIKQLEDFNIDDYIVEE